MGLVWDSFGIGVERQPALPLKSDDSCQMVYFRVKTHEFLEKFSLTCLILFSNRKSLLRPRASSCLCISWAIFWIFAGCRKSTISNYNSSETFNFSALRQGEYFGGLSGCSWRVELTAASVSSERPLIFVRVSLKRVTFLCEAKMFSRCSLTCSVTF